MEDKWYYVMPPNINIMKCELGEKAIEYLWERIEAAREDKVIANQNLAGNIQESLYLKDVDDYFWNTHLEKMCLEYLRNNFYCTSFRNTFTNV